MERIEFDDPFKLADTIGALLDDISDDYPTISVYGKYEVIKDLLEALIMSGKSIANEIELQDFDIAHYDKEFSLYLTNDGINVEKEFEDGHYLWTYADISFVHEDCSSKLLPYVNSEIVYEFGYQNDSDDDTDDEFYYDDCDLNECLHCGNQLDYEEINEDGMHGFTAEKSDGDSYMRYSLYTTTDLSKADIQSLLQEAGF